MAALTAGGTVYAESRAALAGRLDDLRAYVAYQVETLQRADATAEERLAAGCNLMGLDWQLGVIRDAILETRD